MIPRTCSTICWGLILAVASLAVIAQAARAEEVAPAAAPGQAAVAPAAKPEETKTPVAPAATANPDQEKTGKESPAPGEEKKPAPAKKKLTLEEIKELPVFKRYDDASWQKIMEKGRALLSDVKDNTFGYDEEAFYWLVHTVNNLPPDLLKPDAEALPYKALFAMPSGYRGEAVTLRGIYLRVGKFKVPSMALQKDVQFLYEITLAEHERGPEPTYATVIVIDDPVPYIRQFDDVIVKGYFYKIRKYQGERGIGTAPMLVARRLELDQEAPLPDTPGPLGSLENRWLTIIALGILVLAFVAYFMARQFSRKKPHEDRAREMFKFRLRRHRGPQPPAVGGPGGEGGGPKP